MCVYLQFSEADRKVGKLTIDVNLAKKRLEKLQVEAKKWREKYGDVNREAKGFRDEKNLIIMKLTELKEKVTQQEELVRRRCCPRSLFVLAVRS